jgi:hypothetical protein
MTEVGQSGRSTRPGRPGSVGDMGDSESRGRWITFESGPVANHNVFTHLYIFNGEVGSGEGARVATSVGRFVDLAIRQARADHVPGASS